MTTKEDSYKSFSSVAKINRFLHITGQRDNGYHDLQTIFQFLDFGDTLAFCVTKSSDIDLVTPIAGVANDDNLIVKAAKAVQQYANIKEGVKIKLQKQLPMGGGLGGGSSNAATTLLALNKLWQANISNQELQQIGLTLGADVPVFVNGYTAFAEGVGEHLTPVDIDAPWFLITIPNCSISTAAIFTSPLLPRNTPKVNIANIDLQSWQNDCENLVIKLYTEVAKLRGKLLEYAPSRLTGTGACLFSICDSKQHAEYVQSKLPKGVKSFVAKGLAVSPILAELNALQ